MGRELVILVNKQLLVRGRIISYPMCREGDGGVAYITDKRINSVIQRLQLT